MPVNLYLKVVDAFIKYYRDHELSSRLCVDVVNALADICEKAGAGYYDMGNKEGDK